MIHIDPNHLSSTNLISDKIVSWEKPFDSFIPDTGNQPDTRPVPDSTTSATHSPTDGNTASPGRDRSSSLSPAPETGSRPDSPRKEEEEEEEPSRVEPASRLSTPLSELSPPPPDQDDEPGPPAKPKEEVKEEVDETQKEEPPKPEPTPSLESPVTPTTASNAPSDPKVVSILELNLELLRVCMEFQSRGISIAEPRFNQYSVRLQSNLTWLAAAADHSRAGNHSNMLLPTMDAPPSVEWGNMERIQQIYSELPSIFAKEISRRHQMGVIPTIAPPLMSNGGTLKRDRSEELSGDIAMKRRNTGDSKPSASMPPPSIPLTTPMNPSTPNQFPLSIPNGVGPSPLTPGPPHLSPPHSEAQIASLNPGLLTNPSEAQLAAHNRERARQVQIRAAQQQQAARQMSPPSSIPQGGMMTNAVAGPSNPGGMGGMGGMGAGRMPDSSAQQQFLQVLGQPSHPFMQYMLRNVPNFEQFPVQQQVQKMMMVQAQLRQQQQNQGQGSLGQMSHMAKNPMQQISLQMPGMGSQGGHNASLPSNGAFPGGGMGAHPGSPIPPQSPMVPQSANMFGMDNLGGQSGGIGAGPIGGGGGGGGGGMDMRGGGMANNINLNNLTPTQRQQLMMMQQSQFRGNTPGGGGGQMPGGGGGGGGGPMMLNQQQQLSMREQQQRMIQAHAQQQQQQQAGSPPTHPGSPMSGDPTFPALRSNPSIPGIARSTRSPSDGAVSPMTPRVPTRGGAQDDYQRMMQAQQQMQARGMSAGSPVYNPQQQQQQQTQQMGVTGTGWQGNQHQGMQMGLGQQQQGGGASSGYGMSPPPGSAGSHGGMPFSGGGGGGGMNAPSPSSSQNWGSSQSGHGNYPFSPSPGSAHQPPDHSMQMQQQQLRHMSGTPGPQQMQMQMQPQNMGAMPEQSMPTEFDLFNWNGQ